MTDNKTLVSYRLDPEIKAKLAKMAVADRRTSTGQLEYIVEQAWLAWKRSKTEESR